MISFDTNKRAIAELSRLLQGNSKQLKRQLVTAVNKTTTKTKAFIAKKVAADLAVPQKMIKKTVRVQKARGSPSAKLTQKDWNGFPFSQLKARQNSVGVSYKGLKSLGTQMRAGAFQGPKPGAMKASWRGNAFKRTSASRLPIEKQFGPSVIEIFIHMGLTKQAVKFARAQLVKEIKERTRFLGLKKLER